MPKIYRYKKHITTDITREINLPTESTNPSQRLGQEIATVDGITFVSLPDGAVLPTEQPSEIATSIAPVSLDAALRDTIANTSPQVRLIRATVEAKIAEHYSLADEIKLLRTAPSAEFEAYNAHAEACRAWGREQKAALGL